MIIEFKCPHCTANLNIDMENEIEVLCPVCSRTFLLSPDSIESSETSINDSLLDPADPAGYLNNFPMEDDFEF